MNFLELAKSSQTSQSLLSPVWRLLLSGTVRLTFLEFARWIYLSLCSSSLPQPGEKWPVPILPLPASPFIPFLAASEWKSDSLMAKFEQDSWQGGWPVKATCTPVCQEQLTVPSWTSLCSGVCVGGVLCYQPWCHRCTGAGPPRGEAHPCQLFSHRPCWDQPNNEPTWGSGAAE